MRIAPAVCAAAAVVCALTSCGSSDESNEESQSQLSAIVTSANSAISSGREAVESAADEAGSAFDDAKLSAFVTAFRAGYPNLADGRNDDDIESIVTDSCAKIDDGADEKAVSEEIANLAENDGTKPTEDQVGTIYNLVKATCP